MERLARFLLHADAEDSRLGDLSEQYVRHHRRVQERLGEGAWTMALARLIADARYILSASNVTLFARMAGRGLPLAVPVEAKFATPVRTEGTMALPRSDAALRQWLQPALLLTAIAFLAGGALDLWYTWRQTEALIVGLQREKAEVAAAQIEQLLGAVQDKMAWSMDKAAGTPEQRRLDSLRLMRQVSDLTEIAHLDADGKELLRVSRVARDTTGSGADYSGDIRFTEARKRKTYVGAVYFRNASEPYVSLALARDGGNAGVAVAELNLRGVQHAIRSVRSGETGYAFLVDGNGRLVAGLDKNSDGQRPDASQLPQVAAAWGTAATTSQGDSGLFNAGLTGVPVLSAHALVPTPGWRVFVELPIAEARQPLWNALLRGTCVLALGLAAVLLAARATRRRMEPGRLAA